MHLWIVLVSKIYSATLLLWFSSTKISPTCQRVIEGKNTLDFTLGDTTSDHLIWTIFEQLWFFLEIVFYLEKKSIFLLLGPVRRDLSHYQVIDYISKLRKNSGRDWKELFVRKSIFDRFFMKYDLLPNFWNPFCLKFLNQILVIEGSI